MKDFFILLLLFIQCFSCITHNIQEPFNNKTQSNYVFDDLHSTDKQLESQNNNTLSNTYIITSNASELTIDQLYPLIHLANNYMLEGAEFYAFEYSNTESYYNAIKEYSEEKLIKYNEVFTTEFISLLPAVFPDNYYLFSLGNLSTSKYKTGLNRGIDATYQISDWQIEIISDTEVKLVHQAFYSLYPETIEGDEAVYFKNHVLLNKADNSIHELRIYEDRSERLETYYYTLIWEDEHWKFNNFELWY